MYVTLRTHVYVYFVKSILLLLLLLLKLILNIRENFLLKFSLNTHTVLNFLLLPYNNRQSLPYTSARYHTITKLGYQLVLCIIPNKDKLHLQSIRIYVEEISFVWNHSLLNIMIKTSYSSFAHIHNSQVLYHTL